LRAGGQIDSPGEVLRPQLVTGCCINQLNRHVISETGFLHPTEPDFHIPRSSFIRRNRLKCAYQGGPTKRYGLRTVSLLNGRTDICVGLPLEPFQSGPGQSPIMREDTFASQPGGPQEKIRNRLNLNPIRATR